MPKYFNFDNLIKKYSTTFTAIIPATGHYDDSGDWVDGEETKQTMTGAIISHRASKVFQSAGTITAQDRALYMLSPLTDALKRSRIVHDGKEYRIGDELENSEFTGVWGYTLKYVSAFDKEAVNNG